MLEVQQAYKKALVHGYSMFHIPHLENTHVEDACSIAINLSSSIGSISIRESNGGATLIQPNPISGTFSSKIGHAPLHTDSSYRVDPENWILLICVRPAITGGETILVSADDLRIKLRGRENYLQLLTSPLWSFIGPRIFDYPAVHHMPVITPTMIRWRPDCTQPSPNDKNDKLFDVLRWFNDLVMNCKTKTIALRQGDAMLINNWSTLHGRNYFDDHNRLLIRTRIW